jgi:hypothetical protein
MTPTTKAGRRLLEQIRGEESIVEEGGGLVFLLDPVGAIVAVEAEARAAALRDLREEVEGLAYSHLHDDAVYRSAVLDLIDRALGEARI